MREELAEQLLGYILEWDTPTARSEIAELRYLAAVKYDGYRNFEPGHRFMESLALWLRNFDSITERRTAYDFVKHKMLYISEAQMDHLVGLLYPQKVLPILLEKAREVAEIPRYQMRKIKDSQAFDIILRKTLFLGLSDGARMDAFRRKNVLSNEQVCVSYELNEEKLIRLRNDLIKWLEQKGYSTTALFENIFLIDDFSGSGNSILTEDSNGNFKGKLFRFTTEVLGGEGGLNKFCVAEGPHVFIVTYVGTKKALDSLTLNIAKFKQSTTEMKLGRCEILRPIQILDDSVTITPQSNVCDPQFEELLKKYYDNRLEDDHTRTGGCDLVHGYAGCGLPLVLCHNAPNNSLYLLWGSTMKSDAHRGLKALFPRIARHFEAT